MNTANMPIIELSGTSRERGRCYGESAKDLIAETIACWRDNLSNFGLDKNVTHAIDVNTYLKAFFTETNFIPAIERWTPDLLEEVKGIAEGADQPFNDILGLQLVDEEWVFGLRHRYARPTTKCTAFATPNKQAGISYAGQNMDVSSWVDGKQLLLRIMPTGKSPEALVFTNAGNIGLNGLNAPGLGITCNMLAQLRPSATGLPVSFIVRSVLAKKTIDQAEQWLCQMTHASGQNYILSTANDMRCFECGADGIVPYQPEHLKGNLFHTNHPLMCEATTAVLPPEKLRDKNSLARLESISKRLSDTSRPLTLNDIKAALAAHDDPQNPVSRNVNHEASFIGFTAGSSIYEFGKAPRLHLAAGPPCETDFGVFDFKTLVSSNR